RGDQGHASHGDGEVDSGNFWRVSGLLATIRDFYNSRRSMVLHAAKAVALPSSDGAADSPLRQGARLSPPPRHNLHRGDYRILDRLANRKRNAFVQRPSAPGDARDDCVIAVSVRGQYLGRGC